EYELLKRNGSWVEAYECQEIPENTCDLTHDLSSNSNYSIRVQTHCDAVLLALKLTVNLQMDMILVGISTTLSDPIVKLQIWKEDDEENLDDWPKRPPVLQSSSPEPTEPILLLPAEIQCRTMQQTDINVTRDYLLSQTI
ncbi:hypothetical protein DNTS_001851, partial [Danionella cerebrum]